MHSPYSSLRTSPCLSICATRPKNFSRLRTSTTTRLSMSRHDSPSSLIPQSISFPPPRRRKHASPSLRKRTRRGYAEGRLGGIQSWLGLSPVAWQYHLRTHHGGRLSHSSYSSGKCLYATCPTPETQDPASSIQRPSGLLQCLFREARIPSPARGRPSLRALVSSHLGCDSLRPLMFLEDALKSCMAFCCVPTRSQSRIRPGASPTGLPAEAI